MRLLKNMIVVCIGIISIPFVWASDTTKRQTAVENIQSVTDAFGFKEATPYIGNTISSAFLQIDERNATDILEKTVVLAGILSEANPKTVWTIVYFRQKEKTVAEIAIPTQAIQEFFDKKLSAEAFFSLWLWRDYANSDSECNSKALCLLQEAKTKMFADLDGDGNPEKIVLVPIEKNRPQSNLFISVIDSKNHFLWSGPIVNDPEHPLIFSNKANGYRIERIEDIDGDGKAEIVAVEYHALNEAGVAKRKILKWSGNGLTTKTKIDASRSKIKKNSSSDARYLGCYKDTGDAFSMRGHDLHGYGYMSRKLTPEACFLTCARNGFRYAGLQYARSCICDNHYGKYGKANNCNMPCTGDKSKICGGSWANSVYDVSGIHPPAISYDGMERQTDRPGGDYKHIDLPYPDPNLCKNACMKDPDCKAWTFKMPKPDASDFTECWLKKSIPAPVRKKRFVSGVKQVRYAKAFSQTHSKSDNTSIKINIGQWNGVSSKKIDNNPSLRTTVVNTPRHRCQQSLRQYLTLYDTLTQEIHDKNISDMRLVRTLHALRNAKEKYSRCSGKSPDVPTQNHGTIETTTQQCTQEYKRYLDNFRMLEKKLFSLNDLAFVRLRQRYLTSATQYARCIDRTTHNIKNTSSRDTEKEKTVVYSDSILTDAVIALKKLPSGKPDKHTITDRIPNGSTPFYLFIFYKNANPDDRIGTTWYYKKFGDTEEKILFDETGGKLPETEGVFSARIAIEGGSFPPGKYRLVFKVNGKKAMEKYFTIGKAE